MNKGAKEITEKLKSVNRTRVFEQAVEQIRLLIRRGDIPPGDKLPTEQELSAALNMSRSSIREALRVLEAEGLIETRQGSGIFIPLNIPKTSVKDVMNWLRQREESLVQILEVREYIEGLTASLAARNRSVELISELTTLLDQFSEIGKREGSSINLIDDIANLNTSFHLAICKRAGNDIANEILLHILPSFTESNKAVLYTSQTLKTQIQEHSNILEAIRAGDEEKAEKVMRSHIARVKREIQQISEGV